VENVLTPEEFLLRTKRHQNSCEALRDESRHSWRLCCSFGYKLDASIDSGQTNGCYAV